MKYNARNNKGLSGLLPDCIGTPSINISNTNRDFEAEGIMLYILMLNQDKVELLYMINNESNLWEAKKITDKIYDYGIKLSDEGLDAKSNIIKQDAFHIKLLETYNNKPFLSGDIQFDDPEYLEMQAAKYENIARAIPLSNAHTALKIAALYSCRQAVIKPTCEVMNKCAHYKGSLEFMHETKDKGMIREIDANTGLNKARDLIYKVMEKRNPIYTEKIA